MRCPSNITIVQFNFSDFDDGFLDSVEEFSVVTETGERGSLKSIPSDICLLKNLKRLDLSHHQIEDPRFDDSSDCLSKVESIDLTDNNLTELPPGWLRQMPLLRILNISRNGLTRVSSSIFANISHLEKLDLSSNRLTSFELWLMQVKYLINYANNPVTHFSNDCNVDLSNIQSNVTDEIRLINDQGDGSSNNEPKEIHVTDGIFEMSNRCNEAQPSTPQSSKLLLEMVYRIHAQNRGILNLNCSCEQFFIQEYFFMESTGGDFSAYYCDRQIPYSYVELCQNRSSFDFQTAIPRFCMINTSESGSIPQLADPILCSSGRGSVTTAETSPSTEVTTESPSTELPTTSTSTTSPTTSSSTTVTTASTSTTPPTTSSSTALPTTSSSTTVTTTSTSTALATTTPANDSNLKTIADDTYEQLSGITILNQANAEQFATIIDEANQKLLSVKNQTIDDQIQKTFQNITLRMESLLESIVSHINISKMSVAILSLAAKLPILIFSQTNQSSAELLYSTDGQDDDLIASVMIDPTAIGQLAPNETYVLYFLPASLFQYAQKDPRIIVVSPIVGVHLPGTFSRLIKMVFTDRERSPGRYSCVFWQRNDWNDSGCTYSKVPNSDRHSCICNHTTSFALIFIPGKFIAETFLTSLIVSIISIVCLTISIILSLYRQVTVPRRLSIVNIFTLSSTLVLFILLTVFLVRGRQSSEDRAKKNAQCQPSPQTLAIATYFFLLLTFASKTLLGICHFSTMFFRFIVNQLTSTSSRWFFASFIIVILIALAPAIVVRVMTDPLNHPLVQYGDICWFHHAFIFRFVSVPILISIGLNLIILLGITIRLCQFFRHPQVEELRKKRLVVAVMIWVASCISLGMAWIFGPFLDMLIKDDHQSSISVVTQWIFSLFVGLEGLWMLIVNVIFYFNQKRRAADRQPLMVKKRDQP